MMINKQKSRGGRPDFCFRSVCDISPDWLAERSINGLLLDIDNTLTRWEKQRVPEHVLTWLTGIRSAGIQMRLLSNGLGRKRSAVSQQTNIAQVSGIAVKPLPAAFRQGLRELNLPPERVMMVGDIVVTDIIPANRVGIWTCLVEPMSPSDFVGTKVWRWMEQTQDWREPFLPENDFRR
jgi:HAD superfamily phosphatase (TIGR01668 family)